MIAIFGGGFLGKRLARELPNATLLETDIVDRAAVRAALSSGKFEAVINAAGKTGRPNVDWCESHREETYRSNAMGPLVLADVCAEKGMYLLHLGSGCIFYGDSPVPGGWREDDATHPTSFYSRTKYAADVVLAGLPNVAVARLRMPIDAMPGPRNLITKLAGYSKVIDVENSVTIVDDLVKVLGELIVKRGTGVFHVTNPGTMRHRDLLRLYKEIVDPAYTTTFISDEELVSLGLAVKARSNCILASTRLAALGIAMRPIDEALHDTMVRYAAARRSL